MTSTKSRLSKTLLALILALVLTASMLPMFNYTASAATYFSVTGTVVDSGMSTIVITDKNGNHRTFGKEDAKIIVPTGKGIALGDKVKITYSRDNPSLALQISLVSQSSSAQRVPHDTNVRVVLMGVVRDMDTDYITISSGNMRFTFGTDNAHVLGASDGILLGDKVRIIYYSNDPSEAVQILMVTPGKGHNRFGGTTNTYTDANRSWQGWIQDMGNHSMTVQNLANGMTMTFYYDERNNDFPELAIGDVVKVLYNNENSSTALRVIMVDRGTNH